MTYVLWFLTHEATALLAIALAAVLWSIYRYQWIVSPDTAHYLAAMAGKPVPSPFRWRVFPRLLAPLLRPGRPHVQVTHVWAAFSWASLVLSAAHVGVYAEQHGVPGWAAVALFVTLPWFRGLVRNPCLTDQPAMLFALLAATSPVWWHQIVFGLLAGACTERAPVFAAVFAWSPWPLVGLVVPAVAALVTKRGAALDHNDWRRMRALHNQAQPHVFILPWGACLLSVLAPTWQLAAAVGLGAAQLLVATDRSRLLQWGAPVVIVVTLSVVPEWLLPALVLYQVAAPWCDFVSPWK